MEKYKSKRTFWYFKIFFFFLIWDIITIGLVVILSNNPLWVEVNYTHSIYLSITSVVSTISDFVPFSLTEIIILFTILLFLVLLIRRIFLLKNRKISFKNVIASIILFLFCTISIYGSFFYLLGGINYFRLPLSTRYTFDKSKITQKRLRQALYYFVEQTNKYYKPQWDFPIEKLNDVINEEILTFYNKFDKLDIKLKDFPFSSTTKNLILNFYLNYTQVSGFYSPLQEAHFNLTQTPPELPYTIAHEKSHILGYMSEAEANFIAYLVCTGSYYDYLKYSGNFTTMLRLLRNQQLRSEYKHAYSLLLEGVKHDIRIINERYYKYRTIISKIAWNVYDNYLKINKVSAGVKDYGRVINFILAYDNFPPVIIPKLQKDT